MSCNNQRLCCWTSQHAALWRLTFWQLLASIYRSCCEDCRTHTVPYKIVYIHIHTVHILQEGLLVEKMAKLSATHENERPQIVTYIEWILNYMYTYMYIRITYAHVVDQKYNSDNVSIYYIYMYFSWVDFNTQFKHAVNNSSVSNHMQHDNILNGIFNIPYFLEYKSHFWLPNSFSIFGKKFILREYRK